jgi:hypothetical protein
MSKIRQVAQLIRLAAADDDYARDLHEAIRDDPGAIEVLQFGRIDVEDFGQLMPTEWQWFANWRQARGGRLDQDLLRYLTTSATTRFARFQVRALVLRDPDTNRTAIEWPARSEDRPADIGLAWLYGQARLSPRFDYAGLSERRNELSDEAYDRRAQGEHEGSWLSGEAEVQAERERRARRDAALEAQIDRVGREEVDELTTDALQCATRASWYLLSQLALMPYIDLVQERLDRYADEHGLERGWFTGGAPA